MKHVEVGLFNDTRNQRTFSQMVVGLLSTGSSKLPEWIPFVTGREVFAQSVERRFSRWLHNPFVDEVSIYGPLIRQALTHWGNHPLILALDTSMLFEHFCLMQISILYRGRALPLCWQVIEHDSATVSFEELLPLLAQAKGLLSGLDVQEVLLLADRGFADVALMQVLVWMGWHFRIRLKGNFTFSSLQGKKQGQLAHLKLVPGQVKCLHDVLVSGQQWGPLHVAVAQPLEGSDRWCVVSDQPTSLKTFEEYGWRFQIEEGFLDEKSAACHLEDSHLRTASSLNRLLLVLAVALLVLISLGTEVVASGQRRLIDPHWNRGLSYLKLGWRRLHYCLSHGLAAISPLILIGGTDPEPSHLQRKRKPPPSFSYVWQLDFSALS